MKIFQALVLGAFAAKGGKKKAGKFEREFEIEIISNKCPERNKF